MLKGVRVVQHSDVSVELTRVSQDDSMPMCLSIQCRTHTSQHYPSQTQTLEGLTKDEIRISNEALFKGVSTRFGLRTIENINRKSGFHLVVHPSKILVWGA